MNRYTTKHFWRMTKSEQGEGVRYDEYKNETERLRMERDSYRDMYRNTLDEFCNITKKYHKEQSHYETRIDVLFFVLMGTYGAIVGKLIVWSLGL